MCVYMCVYVCVCVFFVPVFTGDGCAFFELLLTASPRPL